MFDALAFRVAGQAEAGIVAFLVLGLALCEAFSGGLCPSILSTGERFGGGGGGG